MEEFRMPEKVKKLTLSIVFPLRTIPHAMEIGKTINQVLLGLKYPESKLGGNTWGSYGGKLNPEETLLQCAIRELSEESDIEANINHLQWAGEIDFHRHHVNNQRSVAKCHIYTIDFSETAVNPKPTREMLAHKWWSIKKVPYKGMLPDYRLWLPKLLSKQKVCGEIHIQEQRIGTKVIDIVTNHKLNFAEEFEYQLV